MDDSVFSDLSERLAAFAAEREWEPFHNPKNLAMALAGEAGELLALFQWLTPEQSSAIMAEASSAVKVRDELADVFAYLLRLASVLDVDLISELTAKIARNEKRYPVELARGTSTKYTDLGTSAP